MSDYIEVDFNGFGHREIEMVADLFVAYDESNITITGLKVGFNKMSGSVFLLDGDDNVYMESDNGLEQFFNCPDCGREGFKDEFEDQQCMSCQEIFNQL